MNLEEKRLSSEYKFKGKIINMRLDEALLPNGETAKREVVEELFMPEAEFTQYMTEKIRLTKIEKQTELVRLLYLFLYG